MMLCRRAISPSVVGTGPAESHSSLLGRAFLCLDLAGIEVAASICTIKMAIGREDSVIAPVAIAIALGGALRATVELHDRDAELSRLIAEIFLDPSAGKDEDTNR